MALSSIFHNFTIIDEKEAERFVDVLDKAAQQPAWEPRSDVDPLIRDPKQIRKITLQAVKAHRDKEND